MGALVKASIPQPTPDRLAYAMSNILLDEFLERISPVGVEDVKHLASFIPVLVLVPRTASEDQLGSEFSINKTDRETTISPSLREVNPNTPPRSWPKHPGPDFVFGDVTVNFSAMEVNRKGAPVVLTTLEFKFLKYLIQNERRVLSRDELLNEVWGYQRYPCTRTVDNHILRLRHKLERDPSRPVHFRTVHGSGYKFSP